MNKALIGYYRKHGRTPRAMVRQRAMVRHFSEEKVDNVPIQYGYGKGGPEVFERLKKKAGNKAASWGYDDFSALQHKKSFTVAKSTVADVLDDISREMLEYQKGGKTPQDFIDNLIPILQQKGWWGKQEVVNPETGKKELVQLGSIGRLKNILMTNIKVANAHGRYLRQMRTAKQRPYLKYQQKERENKREDHSFYHDRVFRAEDPLIWMIYPPNGFGCGCKLISMTEREFKAGGYEVTKVADVEEEITEEMLKFDPRTEWHPDLKKLLPKLREQLQKELEANTKDYGYTEKTEKAIKKSKEYKKTVREKKAPYLNEVEETALKLWEQGDVDNETKAAAGLAILKLPYSGSNRLWSYEPLGIDRMKVGETISLPSHLKANTKKEVVSGWEIIIDNARGKDITDLGFLFDSILPSIRKYKLISKDTEKRIIILRGL